MDAEELNGIDWKKKVWRVGYNNKPREGKNLGLMRRPSRKEKIEGGMVVEISENRKGQVGRRNLEKGLGRVGNEIKTLHNSSISRYGAGTC